MGKKRVHELAKEYGLENKDVLDRLRAAGMSVKTHSSSVPEDEARAALGKAKTAEPAAAPATRRPGMMIVRKKKDKADEAPASAPATAAAPSESAADTDSGAVPASAPGGDVVATLPEAAAPADVSAVSAEPVSPAPTAEPAAAPVPPAAGRQDERETVAPAAAESAAPAPQEAAPAAAQSADTVASPAAPQAAPSAQVSEDGASTAASSGRSAAAPAASTPGGEAEAASNAPSEPTANGGVAPGSRKPGSARVVRMIDRDKLMERVPGRRLGGNGGGAGRGPRQGPGGPGRGMGGPRPGGAPGRGPGGPKFGQVTELRVVTDPFGRGREMVQVGRDRRGRPGGGRPGPGGAGGRRGGRQPSRREMLEMRDHGRGGRGRRKGPKRGGGAIMRQEATQPKASKRIIKMKETIVVADLAHQLGVKAGEVVGKLMGLGLMVTQNQFIDFDTATLIAADYEYKVESVAFSEEQALGGEPKVEEVDENAQPRPPVVTVMGHVDHGKTSLLDAIRNARVTAKEAGGITQHIGAYSVDVPSGGSVTFIDTPGHEAFTSMRARGAQITDIVILVVAADDGVMPQTEEAIRHAQAAKVPIIVALNKIDRPESNAEKVTQELTQFDLLPESWGGETLYVETSATKGTGITELLEAISLQAEVLELKANPDRAAMGMVVEAQLDKGRGPVATVLVQQGTLRRGDHVVVGSHAGRIRAMTDDQGDQVSEVGPSGAVEIIGLEGTPRAGDKFNRTENADTAHEVAAHRQAQEREKERAAVAKVSLDDLMKRMQGDAALECKVVLKADVQGSVEALRTALLKLSTDEVGVNVIHGGVGAIKESDIMLAAASDGIVIGFGVRPDASSRQLAEREGVDVRLYRVIYDAIDDVRRAMEGLLAPERKETVVGRAEVREAFKISKVGTIAGSRVVDGKASRSAFVRVVRDNVEVYSGKVGSLKRFKNDAKEVETGAECGIGVEGYNDVKAGDVLEFFTVEQVARTLESVAKAKRAAAAKSENGNGGGATSQPQA